MKRRTAKQHLYRRAHYNLRSPMRAALARMRARIEFLRQRPTFYLLDENHVAQPISDLHEWATKLHASDNRVALHATPDYTVSTIFLGSDHNYLGNGAPILFETMVFFTDERDRLQDRYCTWDEACAGHDLLCAVAAATIKG